MEAPCTTGDGECRRQRQFFRNPAGAPSSVSPSRDADSAVLLHQFPHQTKRVSRRRCRRPGNPTKNAQ